MTGRLQAIFEEIVPCKVFADIGCDHGYIAEAVLKSGKSEKVIISDISKMSLMKAVRLIGNDERVTAVCGNGFENVGYCDQALIAGMGGEEIISIIERAETLPKRLVLQPMKNADKLRAFLIEKNYHICRDTIFKDQKYYWLIVAESAENKDEYSAAELRYGKENLQRRGKDFIDYLNMEKGKIKKVAIKPDLSEETRFALRKQIKELENIIDERL